MARTLIVCALLAALPSLAPAAEPAVTETVVRLTVAPAAAPRPALKYQLLPELKEMEPGNPIQEYLKCFMEQQNFWFRKDAADNREKWQEMPLDDLPLKEIHNYGYMEGGPLRQVDYAARLDSPDWQILLRAKRDGIHLLLPDIQQMRMVASALKVRCRAEIAERRFDAALGTSKTMFALSRHLGVHPTLIGDLVGMAVANLTESTLEEMVQQPGCPNLYWALTDLPEPFIDLRLGMQGERVGIGAEFAGLDRAAPMSDAQIEQAVARLAEAVKYVEEPHPEVRSWLTKRGLDEEHVSRARERLIKAGLAEARVKQFPVLQVLLLDEQREYEERRDEAMKWMPLPYWQAEPGLIAATAARPNDDALFVKMLPGLLKVRKAQARMEQRLALLRHVEALRLYAAEHDGKLPAQLGDVPVPLPVDPVTGKAFAYEVDGQTAVLRGSPPKGEENSATFNVRFVVTLKK
jgi:hypothetical protein